MSFQMLLCHVSTEGEGHVSWDEEFLWVFFVVVVFKELKQEKKQPLTQFTLQPYCWCTKGI